MKKNVFFIFFFLFIFLFIMNFEFKNKYLMDAPGTDYKLSEKNYISRIDFFDYILYIDLPYELIDMYYLKKIEIIHNDEVIGNIQINKFINEFECHKNLNRCTYTIPEKLINEVLNDKELYKIIRTRFYERGKNYFNFKIEINSKKNNQKEVFIVEDVRIRYKKWYDFEIPYF